MLAPARYSTAWRDKYLDTGVLPERYRQSWAGHFEDLVRAELREGMTVLDMGSGRVPLLQPNARPEVEYVGLDISGDELRLAPAGAYDEIVIQSASEQVASLRGRFDLVVSYQVFEHVNDLDRVIANIHSYLRPGGVLIALLSGRYSPMALLNRAVPFWAARLVNRLLVGRKPETMFAAGYDQCYASAIRHTMRDWAMVSIEPRWEAASYFDFSLFSMRAYLWLENALARGRWEDLATHYFLVARRAD
jgi:SAM-dependent methyltransferase